jgi:2-iminoacetate synthase
MYSNTFYLQPNFRSSNNVFDALLETATNHYADLNINDINTLIEVCLDGKEKKEEVISCVSTQKQKTHNNTLQAIIPQYHTSKCSDDCAYCSFRKSNPHVLRAELNDDDFERELKIILDWGYSVIEFVYATDANFPAKRIAERITKAKQMGKAIGKELEIGINAPSLSLDDYKILNDAGVDFVLLWMETYSDSYKKWHPNNTLKSDFNYRINTFDRSIQAGIKKYAFAVLFGLSDWVEDVLNLIAHGLYLRKTYGVEPYIIGNPRLKRAMGLSVENSKFIIDDENYIFVNYLFKLIFPETKLFINTREEIDINLELIKGGGDFFTIDCGTFPCAYLNPELVKDGHEQFHTSYYNRERTIALLQEKGYKVNF